MVALQAAPSSIVGDWKGVLAPAGEPPLKIALHIKENNASLKATMDSPDQAAYGIPLDEITLKDNAVRFIQKGPGVEFVGTLGGDKIAGAFKQGGGNTPLTFERYVDAGLNRPQTPKAPFPYTSEDVVIENRTAGITLAGTLTIPEGKGPHPAVVLITGSGPQDRDSTIFDHKLFLVLADHLTRQGIAVLRCDDRGIGKSTGVFSTTTFSGFVSDAAVSVDFLKGRKEVDSTRIGLCGHSAGCLVAMDLAANRPDFAFVALLASPGVPSDKLLPEQTVAIIRAMGAPEAAQKEMRGLTEKAIKITSTCKDAGEARERLKKEIPDGGNIAYALTATEIWDIMWVDPADYLSKLRMPVLAIGGSLDCQVPADQNLPAIEAALKKGGNTRFHVKKLPSLNHPFQTATTGGIGEYRQSEETMSPVALNLVSSWMRQQIRLK